MLHPLVGLSIGRNKRFLNTNVHNRINVLSQSSDEHQQHTNWPRDIVYGSTITLSILFILLMITVVFPGICIRANFNRQQSSNILPHVGPLSSEPFDSMVAHHVLQLIRDVPQMLHRSRNDLPSTTPLHSYNPDTTSLSNGPFLPALKF
jgi:hypothetical protein